MEAPKFYPHLPFLTLLKKEILRFLTVFTQTLITPIITASLYLLVFGMSLGSRISVTDHFTYIQFVVPGLILMGIINNAFGNSSSSLFMSRYLGYVVDYVVAPISPTQFILAYTIAAMIRGLLVGTIVLIVSSFFTSLPWAHPLSALALACLVAFMFSQLGLIAAIYSSTFDTLTMYSNFLILPLIYLGGLFYPVKILPEFWQKVSHANPVFYMIDGFRIAVLGHGDTNLALAFLIIGGFSLALFIWASALIGTGYRLKN